MAAGSIKGITVEIGGDTVGLQKALADVNTQSKSLYGELKQVDRMLQLDPGNVTLLAQRTQILNQQVETTGEKLTRLRSVYAQVEAQFNRGDLGEQQWRRFQREVVTTETRLQGFQRELQLTESSAREHGAKIGDALKAGLGAAVAGAGIKEVIGKAMELADTKTTIEVSMDVPKESQQNVLNAVNTIKAYGVDGEAALAGVRRQWQLNGNQSDEVNAKVVKYAGVIAKSYADIDFNELIDQTNKMAAGMGISQEQALGLTNSLLKVGFPPDQIDMISEYGSQLHRAGFTAEQIQGIMAKGVNTKNWSIDNLLDGLKEGRVRMAEFGQGVDKTTGGLLKSAGIGQQKFQEWGKAVAAGGAGGQQAMLEVGKALDGVGDASVRNALGVKIFGTMFEDSGDAITKSLAGGAEAAGKLDEGVKGVAASATTIDASPTVAFNTAMADMQTKLQPILTTLAQIVAKMAEWVANNPNLAATLTTIGVVIGIVSGALAVLTPIFTAIVGLMGAFGVEVTIASAPLWIIIGIIAAVIAIGVLLYKNWDTIRFKLSAFVADIKVQFEAFKAAAETKMNQAKEKITSTWNSVMSFFRGIDLGKIGRDLISGLVNGISGMTGALKRKAHEIANGLPQWMKDVLHISSPSEVMEKIGEQTGQGFINGLSNSIRKVNMTAVDMANTVINKLTEQFNDKDNALGRYFEAIQEDGDWMNDWLTHMPGKVAALAEEMGKILAPNLKGTMHTDPNAAPTNARNISVQINSPKALDAREATKELNRFMNQVSMMW
ncbi:MAG TPA: hypothetical protein VLG50_03685 [Candidatus Saccharimonadales bacterium]|nr:hypothetical protein [Candidatus Saccharimonadales bacterium]